MILYAAGVVLLGNLVSTQIVNSTGRTAGYPADFLPMFGYGMIGMVSALYLFPSTHYLLPLAAGSLAGNTYYLYRAHSRRDLSVTLGAKSLGMGPEGSSPGLAVGFRDLRLGFYRGDIGDQSMPGPNYAGSDSGRNAVERNTATVQSLDLEYRPRVYRGLRWLAGAGITWSDYSYHRSLDPLRNAYWERRFVNYYLASGPGYTFFDRLEVDFQVGYMLLRDRHRESFLREAGSAYLREPSIQASLKTLLSL